jgi:hypothetical protein
MIPDKSNPKLILNLGSLAAETIMVYIKNMGRWKVWGFGYVLVLLVLSSYNGFL